MQNSRPLIVRLLVTAVVAALAGVLGYSFWHYYLRSPWTRDGRVRVEVVNIAAEVAGKVQEVRVSDNQLVAKGDVLFIVDEQTYQLRLAQAEALVESRNAAWRIAIEEAERRTKLGKADVVSSEELHRYEASAAQAKGDYDQAVAQRDSAKLDLVRTKVYSPVNGYVTNLHLRVGDYTTPGATKISVVDTDSFWIAGYFEETKLPSIHLNDPAHIYLMGVDATLEGRVESFTHGIADVNSGVETPGLPSVDPIFTWVRLAQRIPVRIRIDKIPAGVSLAAGQTCTIQINPERPRR